jgi:hypothetical protein
MSNSKFYREKLEYSVSDPSVDNYKQYASNHSWFKLPVNYPLVRERAITAFITTSPKWKNSSVILSDHVKVRETTIIPLYEGSTNDQHPRTLYLYKMNEAWNCYKSSDLTEHSLVIAIKYMLSVAYIDLPSHVDAINSYMKHFSQMRQFVVVPYYMAKLVGFRQSVISSARAYRSRFGISVVHDEVKRLPTDLFSTHFVTCASFSSPSRNERMFVGTTGKIIVSVKCVPEEHKILMKSSFIPKMHLVNYVTTSPISSSISAYDTFVSILNCDVSTRIGYQYGRELTMVSQASPPTLMFGIDSFYLGEVGEYIDMFPDNDYSDLLYEFLIQFDYESVAFMIKLFGLADAINLVDGKFFPEYNEAIEYAIYLVWTGLFYDLVLHYHGVCSSNLRIDSRPASTVFPHMPFSQYNRLMTLSTRISAYDRYCISDQGVFLLGYVVRDMLFGLSLRYAQDEIRVYGDSSTHDCLEIATIVFANCHMVQSQVLLNSVTSITIEGTQAKFEFYDDVHLMVYPYYTHHGYVHSTSIMAYINRLRCGVNWLGIFNEVKTKSYSSLTSTVPSHIVDQVSARFSKYELAKFTLSDVLYEPERAICESEWKPLENDVCEDIRSSGLHVVAPELNGDKGSVTGTDDHEQFDLFSRNIKDDSPGSMLDQAVSEYAQLPSTDFEVVDLLGGAHVVSNQFDEDGMVLNDAGDESESDNESNDYVIDPSDGDFYGSNGESFQELLEVFIQYVTPDQAGE